jgi:hypothetical protein
MPTIGTSGSISIFTPYSTHISQLTWRLREVSNRQGGGDFLNPQQLQSGHGGGIRGRGECARNVGEVGLNRLFALVKFRFIIYASLPIFNIQILIGFYSSLG